jgi:hypothetical protein
VRARAWVVAGGAIALAVVVVFFTRQEPAIVVTETAVPAAPPVTDVRAQDVPPPGTEIAAARVPPGTEPDPSQAPLPTAPVGTPLVQLLAEAGKEPPLQLANSEREFLAENVDTAWAPAAEARILGKIAEEPGLKLVSLQVECRTTLCRLLVTMPTSGDEESPRTGALFNAKLHNAIEMRPRWIVVVPRGNSLNVVAYLQRPGAETPFGSFIFAPPNEQSSVDP